ncbi:MAG: hypothetical protein J0653_01340, partial [Deltaproteobacteria bacterium]|nr:hypothetical protein [Deltaproteobacteria bacterium]
MLSKLLSPRAKAGGFLTDAIRRWCLWGEFSASKDGSTIWIEQFRKEWTALSARLNQIRLELVLHTAAMFFASGAVLGMYLQAGKMGYLAGLDITYSDEFVHFIGSIVLAPGLRWFNKSFPDVEHLASLRIPNNPGENALYWVHLYALSIIAWIIIPRLVLVLTNSLSSWRQRRSFPLPINNTYFRTLRTIHRGGSPIVSAIPFRYDLTPQIRHNLQKLLERIHGLTVDVLIQQPVLMGENT